MKRVKVLFIHTLPVVSGSGLHALTTMQGLKYKGYEVEFACAPGGPLNEEVIKSGITFRPIKHFVHEINVFSDLAALFELIALMRKHKYDIVHSHNSKAGFLSRLAAKIAQVPIIIHSIHGFAFHEYEKPPRRALFILLEKLAAHFADMLIAVSTPLMEWGLRLGIGEAKKYRVIYSGIEIERFKINTDPAGKRAELGLHPDDLVVGLCAKLWEGKGHEVLLEAAPMIIKEAPCVKFLFVGEGELRPKLEKIVLTHGLKDYVIFTGFRSDIPEITAVFDIAVLASFFEGLGRVILEAMVMGKPVVATSVGGIPELVKDGKNGFLVPVADCKALAEAIACLLKDKSLRLSMGEAGRKMVDEKFSAERTTAEIEEIYQELLKKKGILK
ncbi:MAG: glycosyltransferase family 4 protein [Candidatus Omnitrophota bacterium]